MVLELLDRLWRLVATALCFTTFGVGGLLLWFLVFPLLSLLVRDRVRQSALARRMIHYLFRFFVGLMRGLGVLTYEVHGLDKLQRSGLLILANHPSLVDVVFLIALTPRADCVVKAALQHNPFTRAAVRTAGYIHNETGPAMVGDCIATLQRGNHLIIFPEGTRTVVGQALQLQRGAANVAVRGGVDVTPVVIRCQPSTLTKGEPWWRIPARRPHFVFRIQDDLSVAAVTQGCTSDALAARRLTDYLADYFAKETARDG